jgi:hypothetical protein
MDVRGSMLIRWARAAALWAALACAGQIAWSQAPPARESAVKAAFLFKFTSFVEWPAGTFQRPDQPLVIGVLGAEEVAGDLEQMVAGRNVEGHPVQTRRISDAAGAAGAHVLYIGNRTDTRLRAAIDAVTGPVLIVSDQAGALRQGSVLNFAEEAGRVRFSASLPSAEARGLKLSSRLLEVAQNVEGRAR